MVMKIRFIKPLPAENGFKTPTRDTFSPELDNVIYTVIVRNDDYVKMFTGSIEVADGRQEDLVSLIKAGYIQFNQC